MKTFRIAAAAALVSFLVPAVAFAGVTFKNKEKKKVALSIKRAGSTEEEEVPGSITMEIPGPPMTITIKLPGKSKAPPPTVDANDGDTVTWEKGKLTKQVADTDTGETPESAPSDGQ